MTALVCSIIGSGLILRIRSPPLRLHLRLQRALNLILLAGSRGLQRISLSQADDQF